MEIRIRLGNSFEEKSVKVCLRILRDFEILLEQNSKCLEAINMGFSSLNSQEVSSPSLNFTTLSATLAIS